jgi:hypothetical protein
MDKCSRPSWSPAVFAPNRKHIGDSRATAWRQFRQLLAHFSVQGEASECEPRTVTPRPRLYRADRMLR